MFEKGKKVYGNIRKMSVSLARSWQEPPLGSVGKS